MGFWEVLEDLMSLEIPLHVKNILTLYGLDNAPAMRNINDELIKQIEKFVHEDMLRRIPTDANLKDYFGGYENEIDKFKFVGGHIILLKEIVIFINDTISKSSCLKDGFLVFKTPSAVKVAELKSGLKKSGAKNKNKSIPDASASTSNICDSANTAKETINVCEIDINKFTDLLFRRVKSFLTLKKLNEVNYLKQKSRNENNFLYSIGI